MSAKRRWRGAAILLATLLGCYLMLAGVYGVLLTEVAFHPPKRPLSAAHRQQAEALADSAGGRLEDVAIIAADGSELRAWYLSGWEQRREAVIFLHGVADNRVSGLRIGAFLLGEGYSVLLPDSRAQGESSGAPVTYGVREADDVQRWLSWLTTDRGARLLFGIGQSMGAGILLQATAEAEGLQRPPIPQLCAVVAEAPFSSFREIAYDRLSQPIYRHPEASGLLGRTLLRPVVEAGFLYARLRYQVDMELAAPDATVASGSGHVPVLLIRGGRDDNIPLRHARRIASLGAGDVTMWLAPGADHGGVYNSAPEEFERRVLAWFRSHGGCRASVPRR